MPKYRVRITEEVEYVVDVEAPSKEDAHDTALDAHIGEPERPGVPKVEFKGVLDRDVYATELDDDGNEINDEEE